MDLVLKMSVNILLSTRKFSKEGHVLVYDKEEVNIYNATNTDMDMNFKEILTGHFSKNTGMCHIPLKEKVENETTNTLVVNWPDTIHYLKCV